MSIHAPKIEIFGAFYAQRGSSIKAIPKGTSLHMTYRSLKFRCDIKQLFPILFSVVDNPQNCPFPFPLVFWTPSDTWFPGPIESVYYCYY